MDNGTPSGLLSRSPEEGARLLALAYLDQAAAARLRLEDPSDTEALHDFRVGLRRLRSCLRSYRRYLEGSIPGKLAKRLRRLASSTGPGRDTEVQIEWLRGRSRHLSSQHRTGLAWLLARLEERMREAYEDLGDRIPQEFPELEEKLRHRLSIYRAEIHLGALSHRVTFGEATAEILRDQIAELTGHLARVDDAEDQEEAHEARISAKRLRYLIEPLVADLPAAAPLVKRFKALQDLLGDLHDAHVLEIELGEAVEEAAAERARKLLEITLSDAPDETLLRAERRRSREAGLLTLARLNRARRNRLFETLDAEWLEGRAGPFLEEVEALGRVMGRDEESGGVCA
ncbi:MAG TPA: CHAD domain-containing protein [Thermoanaerobaculia bacterium]|nr:CHAD domain-containing protein [Thermoanaerobaculia bacterium]